MVTKARKPTKAQILAAAEMLVDQVTCYSCNALSLATNTDFDKQEIYLAEYMLMFAPATHYTFANAFGDSNVPENQLARSLALLLYAEARKDVLRD